MLNSITKSYIIDSNDIRFIRITAYQKISVRKITNKPYLMGGRPTIRGLRFSVGDGLELLACGLWEQEILAEHPVLEKEDIKASL